MMYRGCLLLSIFAFSGLSGYADCTGCTNIQPGTVLGTNSSSAVSEASGLAASRRNAGVLWTHNDGSRDRLYAFKTNGTLLAVYDFNGNVEDVEDLAVGPGPQAGTSYMYIGDIGGTGGTNIVRSEVKIVRVPEPRVDRAWATNPPSADFQGVETFTLTYPDGSYDAEALLLDPILGELFIATKDPAATRLYRANIFSATNGATLALEFVTSVAFANASGGAISHDGSQIILRREDAALLWARCDNEPIADALARAGEPVPVIGPPSEPNGEGIAFVASGSGYLTISEGSRPPIYFFESLCPAAPQFTLELSDQSGFIGGNVRFEVMTVAYPPPVYTWHFNGKVLPAETNSFLVLSNLTSTNAGLYTLTASNEHGTITNAATLSVRTKPDLRITEVLPSAANNPSVMTADWWELTSFETQPVNLSRWRFNDNGGGLTDPFAIPFGVIIGPRESIIFVENITAQQFRSWWGATNLPPSLQIISYSGNGLGLGAGGDGLRLWDSATADVSDTAARVDFGVADTGVTFNFDPFTGQFGPKSQLGVNGVFRAAVGTDIGSPGRIVAAATPPLLSATLSGGTFRIEFDAAVGHRYSLQVRSDFGTDSWSSTGDSLIATYNARLYFEKPSNATYRFYQVLVD